MMLLCNLLLKRETIKFNCFRMCFGNTQQTLRALIIFFTHNYAIEWKDQRKKADRRESFPSFANSL